MLRLLTSTAHLTAIVLSSGGVATQLAFPNLDICLS